MPKPLDRRYRNREHDAKRRAEHPWRKLYNTARWQALRATVFLRDSYQCRHCGGLTAKPAADHIKPHHGDLGLFWDEDNIQTLCPPCHDTWKQKIEAKGFEVGCDAGGRPIAADHPWNAGR